jgi:two-component system, LuxR family, response regulator FixJ
MPLARRPPENRDNRVCIVEDDKSVTDSLKVLLETFGFDVQSYNSGAEFFADSRRRTVGCLVIDQHMPGMNGLDVVDRLRGEGVRLPTILISGRVEAKTRDRAASLGVTTVIEKPFAADRLVEIIRATLIERS